MEQHMAALEQANKIRLGKAQIKRNLRDGIVTIPELVSESPHELNNIPLYEVLTAMTHWGRHRVMRVFDKLDCSEGIKFGALTERQKKILIEVFN